jgi:hypothetical protein
MTGDGVAGWEADLLAAGPPPPGDDTHPPDCRCAVCRRFAVLYRLGEGGPLRYQVTVCLPGPATITAGATGRNAREVRAGMAALFGQPQRRVHVERITPRGRRRG